MEVNYGSMTSRAISTVLKELVRRASVRIYDRRVFHEATSKVGYDGISPDVFTDADVAAQRAYVEHLRESFPTYGIVAEEENLVVPCTDPNHDFWFTVDPLDGTKAFVRRQFHGVGSMVALVCDGEIISAYVGGVNEKEIFGFRPGSSNVYRISDLDTVERLVRTDDRSLKQLSVMLRDGSDMYSAPVQHLVSHKTGIFKRLTITDGSIGMAASHMWIGLVGAMVIHPGWQTPWDLIPVLGEPLQNSTPTHPNSTCLTWLKCGKI